MKPVLLPLITRWRFLIERLSSKQRAHLRALAHDLKPVLRIGKDGVTPTVLEAVEDAFNTRELLKIKVLEGAPASAQEIGVELMERMENVHLVQTLGRIATLYRSDPDTPKIQLPK